MTESFTYRGFTDTNTTTGQVEGLTISASGLNRTYTYTYDKNGNIKSVSDGTNETSYVYDTAGQLLRENNQAAGKTWVWTYDNAGNIKTRKEYAYTAGTLGEVLATVNYGYNNANWKDLLTSYGDKSITYDEIGNPLNDGSWAYSWEHGRQLASMTNGTTTIDYEYNADGIRTKKTVTTASNHTHVFQSNVVAPTCTENGHTLHVCSCGYIYQDTPVAATGHTFTTTVIESTCTTNGYTLKECACGYSYQGGSSGHSFTTLVVEPTETLNGFTLHECECGYSYESDPVASIGSATAASEEGVSDTKVYDYVYNGSSLVHLTITTNTYGENQVVETLYFGNGTVTYNDVVYYYVTNLQGDVVAILDSNGTVVVEYTYDAWGNILTTSGTMATTLGVANPLTYRGYVYDAESGLYYLQSRYYNPNVGRFLNADSYVSTGQGFIGCNMFAYCRNNPVRRVDISGRADVDTNMTDDPIQDLMDQNEQGGSGGRHSGGGGNGSGTGNGGSTSGHKNSTTKWNTNYNSQGEAKTTYKGSSMTAKKDSNGYYWLRDKSGHGGSYYKVFIKSGNYLKWVYDADMYGNFIYDKHKSETGQYLPLGVITYGLYSV